MSDTLTPSILRPLLAELRRTRPDELLIGVQLDGAWTGDDAVRLDGEPRPIRVCRSSIDVRAAAVEQETLGGPLIVLTPLKDRELGLDVTSRLAGQQLLRPSLARAVMHLFHAHDLDRRIAREEWMLRALVENMPPEGYQPVPSGSLTEDRAWEELLRVVLSLQTASPSLSDLLRWSQSDDAGTRFRAADAALRSGLRTRVRQVDGAELLLAMIEHGRYADDVLALIGLLSVLVTAPNEPPVLLAAGRVAERDLGGHAVDLVDAAPALVASATALARELHLSADASTWSARASNRCDELGLDVYVSGSDLLNASWSARLEEFAHATMRSLGEGEPQEGIRRASEAIHRHVRADDPLESDLLDGLEAMTQLLRWLALPEGTAPSSLSGSVAEEVQDGSWVVWARARVPTSTVPALDDAAARLAHAVDDRRIVSSLRFAAAAARWDGEATAELLGVEHVLDRVVAPTARVVPVVVIVLDGMSLAVMRQLLHGLAREGWSERRVASMVSRPAALAVLPSLTTLSRASLLTGHLQDGGQAVERAGFAAHSGLREAGTDGGTPLLLHKASLSEDGVTLASTVRDEIFGSRRIVGLVINAIDDQLSGAVQRRGQWSVREIPLLDAALAAARNAERAVVLLSDHGHVPERAETHRVEIEVAGAGIGDRNRPVTSGAVRPGEVLAEGPRVLTPERRIVLAADPAIRYTAASKPGYHGGASPEEMLAPVAILTALDQPLDGLNDQDVDEPSWWRLDTDSPPPIAVDGPPSRVHVRRGATGPGPEQPMLDGLIEPELPAATAPQPAPAWVDAVLAHPAFRKARERAGRGALPDDRVRALLVALGRHDGRLSTAALAVAADVPRSRLDGALSALRPLLNVDGYPILTVDVDADLVQLNIDDLRHQLGI